MDGRHPSDNSVVFDKGHPCELLALSEVAEQLTKKEMALFVREYFASATVSCELLNKIVSFCEDSSQQQLLGDILSTISSCVENYHFRKSHRNALKYIIEQLERKHAEIGWQLYSCLTNSMMENSVHVDRIYFDESFSKFIRVQENRCHLSQGNTGLSCWQASCDLANYLLKHGRDYISGSNILELGAGCGLLGIALAASGLVKSITLSDGCVEDCDVFNVVFLEWETLNVKDIPVAPDVVLATDVIYDALTIKPLVHAIRKLLVEFGKEVETGPCCLLANTVRNQETVDKFLACAGENGLSLKNCFTYENGIFKCSARNIEDQSFFPFTSSIQCPTIFCELILKN